MAHQAPRTSTSGARVVAQPRCPEGATGGVEGRATPRTTRSGKRLERVSPRTTRRSLRKRSAGFGPESGLSGAPPRDALTPIGLCSAQITE